MTRSDVVAGPVLLTGASGLLGHWLLATRPRGIEVVALTHRRTVTGVASATVDLRDVVAVRRVVSAIGPSVILHAAYVKELTSIVDATRSLVDAATANGSGFVHISTDAVFEGDGVERDERSEPDAVWDYGCWKAEAERIVLGQLPDAAVIRPSLLVSVEPDDQGVEKIRAGAARGTATTWYSDEFRRPGLASEVAVALWQIVALPTVERGGVWHLAGPERLSRYELAGRVATRLGLPASSVVSEPRPAGSDRPRDIAFTDARARTVIGWNPSSIT